MRKQIFGYIALLCVALGVAYLASNPADDKGEMANDWYSIKPDQIKSIRYEDPQVKTKIEPKDFGYWAEVEEKKKLPDGSEKTEEEAFKASGEMKPIEEELNPLVALRVVGSAKDQNLADYGLQEQNRKFVVEPKSGPALTLIIGKKSYGSREAFALDEAKQEVILISGNIVDQVKNARTRLYERDIVKAEDERIKKAEVTHQGKTVRWDHSERDQNGALLWRDDKEGAPAQASYRNWMDKIYKTKVMSFPSLEEQKRISSLQPFLVVTFFGERGEIDKVSFFKEEGDKYYATSSSLKTWVAVNPSRITPIEKDIEGIMKGG